MRASVARMALCLALFLSSFSQVAAASPVAGPVVRGTVTDSAGAPLANAQVVISALGRSTTTDDQGRFSFSALPAGVHQITAMLIGHAPSHASVVVSADGADVAVAIVMHATPLQIAGVQVTATPVGTDPRDVPQATLDLSGQQLSRQLGSTLAQSLSDEPGISVRFSGPAATAPIIRGLQGERVLVLEDGNRAADLSSAAPDHGTSIDPLAAQRIEVVRGPASLLYGNQALGGVVNVISNDIPTSIPSHVEGTFAANSESVTPGGAAMLGFTVPVGSDFAVVAKGGGRHTEDLRMGGGETLANSFYRNYYGVGGFGFSKGDATGGLVFREYQFQYGLPSGDGERSKIDGHRHELVGRTDIALNNPFITSLRVSGTAQWYGHSEIDEESGATNTSFDLKTQTLDLLGHTRFGRIDGAVGVSGLFKQYAALGDEALTPAATSNGLGAFVFQEVPLTHAGSRSPKLQVGGRYDRYRIDVDRNADPKFDPFVGTRSYDEASGSVGLSVPLNDALTFAVSTARAFRAPSVEELSSNAFHEAEGAYDVGNPNLKAEVNQGIEGVLHLDSRKANGEASVFWNSIQNFVTPNIVKDTTVDGDDGPIDVPLNRISQADARLHGVEAAFETEVAPHIVVGAMGDMVRGEIAATKEPLPYIPAARLGGHLRWDDGKVSIQGDYKHAFAQNRVPPAVSEDDPSGIATSSYDLANVSVGWTIAAGDRTNSITVRVDNLFDEKYVEATSRLKTFAYNPGRNFSVVYRVLF